MIRPPRSCPASSRAVGGRGDATSRRRRCGLATGVACLLLVTARAGAAPGVEAFSPQGSARNVQQVQARFATAMVALGAPTHADPFDVECATPGRGRWLDPRQWVFEFAQRLPAGLRCRFSPRAGLRDAAGARLQGLRAFAFDTGGPAILQSAPWAGSVVEEDQVFLLGLDVPATRDSILAHARCRIEGMAETAGVELVAEEARAQLLEANPRFLRQYVQARYPDPAAAGFVPRDASDEPVARAAYAALIADPESPLVALQCQRRLPDGARMWLDWGPGIATTGGQATPDTVSLEFTTREAFRATFRCERLNRDGACIPLLDMSLAFSGGIPLETARALRLTGADGKHYPAVVAADSNLVTAVRFKGPFPPRSSFTLELPSLRDDAGRALVNAERFPLTIRTGEDPPLAKFAAPFGIVELHGHSALPVTVRNLEPHLKRAITVPLPAPRGLAGIVRDVLTGGPELPASEPATATLRGRVLRFEATDPVAFGRWFKAVRDAQRDDWQWDPVTGQSVLTRRAGVTSLLTEAPRATALEVPRSAHAKAFEVIGVPLPAPGVYVVELASPRLGAALLDPPAPYYVQAMALVTNLGVHFKWGRESSLAWVTALDTGKGVADADIRIRDCAGGIRWRGRTDASGVAHIVRPLPRASDLPVCDWNSQGLSVHARRGDDVGMVATSWNEGIENWRYGLPAATWSAPALVHTVLDRMLFRAGETVHMKHFLRRHAGQGLAPLKLAPFTLRARHAGSDAEFPLDTAMDSATASGESTWKIPRDAQQGTYRIEYRAADRWLTTGDFRVESFRVPLLHATLTPPPVPQIASTAVTLQAHARYLAGDAAGGLPLRLRGLLRPHPVSFEEYPAFLFLNGDVREGSEDTAEDAWRYQDAAAATRQQALPTREAMLDKAGTATLHFDDLPVADTPRLLNAEIEYPDPNGATLTTAIGIPLWPADMILGLQATQWTRSAREVRVQALALALDGKPRPGVEVVFDLFQRQTFSHRKRLLGGFYAYENRIETRRIEGTCKGRSDAQGFVHCTIPSPVSGRVVVRAQARDGAGRVASANREAWIAGEDDWWFGAGDEDRIEVVPERRNYEPGDTARLQVRMPFREATALVTVEREGVLEHFVTPLSGKAPTIDVPLAGHHAPNVFVSVLVVRGRLGDVAPTATFDPGRPAYKLGFAELRVGWRAHALKVEVKPLRESYRPRETAQVDVTVRTADGTQLAPDAEVALAAVDEGLLELRANDSWQVLAAMMGRRGNEVVSATAQMQVIGKRHFGRKAVAAGGGGGQTQGTRELFDTLLAWQARVRLDAQGKARVDVPLNDALTGFRIVAIASAGAARFGTGNATLRTTQPLMSFAGLPPTVREGDRFPARFTLRNTLPQPLTVTAEATLRVRGEDGRDFPYAGDLARQTLTLPEMSAATVAFDVTVPAGATALAWTLTTTAASATEESDRLAARQAVLPAVPVETVQGGLQQLTAPLALPARAPADALPGRGGLVLDLDATLTGALDATRAYVAAYPFAGLEQRASRAVAMRDRAAWRALMADLPASLDSRGLARFFNTGTDAPGSDTLSAYLLALADSAGWPVPEPARTRLRDGLVQFVEGRLQLDDTVRAPDLTQRRLAALAALARQPEGFDLAWLDALTPEPTRWPTASVLDWLDILARVPTLPRHAARHSDALRTLRGRLDRQPRTLLLKRAPGAADETFPWLLVTPDATQNRLLLSVMEEAEWSEDLPALLGGSLARQQRGHWDTPLASAWGVLAFERFSRRFEAVPITGTTTLMFGDALRDVTWPAPGTPLTLPWPTGEAQLRAHHAGDGRPWLAWQARAAVPLTAPRFAGYRLRREVLPVRQRVAGEWHVGDTARVRLAISAPTDMAWVAVQDPVPAGASILGSGLGGDSAYLAGEGADSSALTPTFSERGFAAYTAYLALLPQGEWHLQYMLRLNAAGEFILPATRVEAMYAPGMFALAPNAGMRVAE